MSYRVRRRGMGAADDIYGPKPSADYYPIYNPGTIFMNACKTESNPDGWVPGSGGYASRPPISAMWYAQSPEYRRDSLRLAAQNVANGIYGACPGSVAQIPGNSPFLPGYVPPASSGNTPLFNWSGGYVATPPAAAAASGPQLSFTTSRGGTTLYPGDTWTIKITGAAPSSPVVVVGGKAGAKDSATMGNTDSAGNYSTSGAITADQAGAWSESWSVGGKSVGSFGFTVNTGVPTTPAGDVIINSSGAQTVKPGASPPAAGFSFSSIPWYVWAGVAGVGLYAMNSKGGR